MAHHLPYEIIRHILEYVPSIDIRRHFGIYRKLKPNLWLQTICWHKSAIIDDDYVCYYLYNEHDLATRSIQLVSNDTISMSYQNHPTGFYYRRILQRLKKKSDTVKCDNYYHKGSFKDYYWDSLEYDYTRI